MLLMRFVDVLVKYPLVSFESEGKTYALEMLSLTKGALIVAMF